MPEVWIASTVIGMPRPVDATEPACGVIRVTWSACTFERKIVSVSSAKLPAPSTARPTIWMKPPAPEFAGKVTVQFLVYVFTVPMNTVSATASRPPVNVRRISFSAMLSMADTLKCSPLAMGCVSPAVLLNVMFGSWVSGWRPPMCRVVSHAHRARAETAIPQSAVPRRACRMCSPGLLPGGRHQVVDDMGRDQNQEITPVLQLGRETEQPAQDG